MVNAKRLNQIEYLSPLPDVIEKIQEIFMYKKTNLSDISELISLDPALTLSLLNYANSFEPNIQEIDSIDEACLMLGSKNIYEAIENSFVFSKKRSYSSLEGNIWKHAIASAVICGKLAEKVDAELTTLAYTSGLIHDVGYMILAQYFYEDLKKIVSKVKNDSIAFLDAEKEILDFTHTEIGKNIAEKWGLPLVLTEVIAYHHNPTLASYNPKLVAIVNFSDIICARAGIGLPGDVLDNLITQDILKITKFDGEVSESIIFCVQEILDYYNISMDTF